MLHCYSVSVRVVFLFVILGRQITIDVEFCAIGDTHLVGRQTRCVFQLRSKELSWKRLFLYCHSTLVNEFAPIGILYPIGNILYNDKSSPAFVSFTTNTTIVPGKKGGNVAVKVEGEKVLSQATPVNRQLRFGQDTVSDHTSKKGRNGLSIAKMEQGRTRYGTATASGSGEVNKQEWTIKHYNSEEDEKKPVSNNEVKRLA